MHTSESLTRRRGPGKAGRNDPGTQLVQPTADLSSDNGTANSIPVLSMGLLEGAENDYVGQTQIDSSPSGQSNHGSVSSDLSSGPERGGVLDIDRAHHTRNGTTGRSLDMH